MTRGSVVDKHQWRQIDDCCGLQTQTTNFVGGWTPSFVCANKSADSSSHEERSLCTSFQPWIAAPTSERPSKHREQHNRHHEFESDEKTSSKAEFESQSFVNVTRETHGWEVSRRQP